MPWLSEEITEELKKYLQAQSSKDKRANELNKKISDDIAENRRTLFAEDDKLKKNLDKPKTHYVDFMAISFGGIIISFFCWFIFQDTHTRKEKYLRHVKCSPSDPKDCELLRRVPRANGGAFYGTESHN